MEWKIGDIEVIRKQGQRPHGDTLNPQHGTNLVFKIGCLCSWEWMGHIGFVSIGESENTCHVSVRVKLLSVLQYYCGPLVNVQ